MAALVPILAPPPGSTTEKVFAVSRTFMVVQVEACRFMSMTGLIVDLIE